MKYGGNKATAVIWITSKEKCTISDDKRNKQQQIGKSNEKDGKFRGWDGR